MNPPEPVSTYCDDYLVPMATEIRRKQAQDPFSPTRGQLFRVTMSAYGLGLQDVYEAVLEAQGTAYPEPSFSTALNCSVILHTHRSTYE